MNNLRQVSKKVLLKHLKVGDVLCGVLYYTVKEIEKDHVHVVYGDNCRGIIEKSEIGNNGEWFKLIR